MQRLSAAASAASKSSVPTLVRLDYYSALVVELATMPLCLYGDDVATPRCTTCTRVQRMTRKESENSSDLSFRASLLAMRYERVSKF